MRSRYFIAYDICSPGRLRRVYRIMRGYGDHLQLSVFRCDLTSQELVLLRGALEETINQAEDQVLIVDIGPAEGRGSGCVTAIGLPYTHPEHHAIVV